jgi:hypothetical protein
MERVRLEFSHRYIVVSIIITTDGAIDVLGCDIDIDMMTKVLTSMPSIIKTFRKHQLSSK